MIEKTRLEHLSGITQMRKMMKILQKKVYSELMISLKMKRVKCISKKLQEEVEEEAEEEPEEVVLVLLEKKVKKDQKEVDQRKPPEVVPNSLRS